MLKIDRLLGLHLIDESVQLGGSFKIRGVAQFFRSRPRRQLERPIVTFTSGNHGIAVALLARPLHRSPTVIIPTWAEPDKRDLLTRLGCTVRCEGETATECEDAAQRVSAEIGGVMLHPFRSMLQIVGYTSLWSEIAEAFPDGADIAVPVGSGGLFAAGVLYRAITNAKYRIVGVESEQCPSLARSLNAGRPCQVSTRSHFAPALNVNVTPMEWFDLVQATEGCDLITVSDKEMAAAASYMSACDSPIDPAAAAGLAFAFFSGYRPRSGRLVVIVTGRGARVSAESLRQLGLLNEDLESIKRTLGGIRRIESAIVQTTPRMPSALENRALLFAREELRFG